MTLRAPMPLPAEAYKRLYFSSIDKKETEFGNTALHVRIPGGVYM